MNIHIHRVSLQQFLAVIFASAHVGRKSERAAAATKAWNTSNVRRELLLARERKRINFQRLSYDSGYSITSLGHWLSGRNAPTFAELSDVCTALGLCIEAFQIGLKK